MVNKNVEIQKFRSSLLAEKHTGKYKDVLNHIKHMYAAENEWFKYLECPEDYEDPDDYEAVEVILIAVVDNFDDFLPDGPEPGDESGYFSANEYIEESIMARWILCNVPDINVRAVLASDISDDPTAEDIRKIASSWKGKPGVVWQVW